MGVKTLAQAASLLEKQINTVKYVLFCVNIIIWITGAFLFGLSVALRWDSELQEWIEAVGIWQFYVGVYILIFASFVVLIVPFLSFIAVYQEINQLLLLNMVGHGACFLLLMIGNAVLVENSSTNSSVKYSVREGMNRLISYSYDSGVAQTLNMIQEDIGCCGADGPNDYLMLRKPLPNECRDTVTGNAYYYGCAEEFTWFLEDKAYWLTSIATVLAFMHGIVVTLTLILLQALSKEEKMTYRR